MSRVKQQHTEPRFHLRGFANAGQQIHVFDKMALRSFRTNVDNVATENAFYDIPEMEEKGFPPQYVEGHFLRGFEVKAKSDIDAVVRSVAAGTFRRLRGKRRSRLANWVVVQWLRSREHREEVSVLTRLSHEIAFRAHLAETKPELANAPFSLTLTPDAERARHVATMLDLDHIAELAWILMDHVWEVLLTDRSMPFWTSDNPVVRFGHFRQPDGRRLRGFGSRGVEIAYPLSPTTLVSIRDSRMFAAPLRVGPRTIAAERVNFYNWLQVRDSTRFLFSSSPDFALAEDRCRRSPLLRDPKRPRFSVVAIPSGTDDKNPPD